MFVDELKLAIEGWSKDPIEDEWLFDNFREQHVSVLEPEEAFNAINQTVDILTSITDESTAIEVLQTIISLARRSKTTEIPSGLQANLEAISSQFLAYDAYAKNKVKELFSYYRIPQSSTVSNQ